MRYSLVCLDAGFTLLAPRRTLAQTLAGVLEQRGHPVSTDEIHRAWEVADRWFWDEYHRPENETWGHDDRIEQTWREYHTVMLEEIGYRDRSHDFLDAILASQFAPDSWELYPDVEPALSSLRQLPGLQVAVVSDWGSSLHGLLAGLGLDRYLDFVLASGAVGVSKPNPAFFRIALERAGVEPAEALMVGDSLRADVQGAQAAGMDGVLLVRPEGAAQTDQLIEDVPRIASLAELPRLVSGG
jgi:putative hydrolase of the HAD superfamily